MPTSIPSTITPLIDRILSSPLTFVPAKQAKKDNDATPSSYIVLSGKASETGPVKRVKKEVAPPSSPKARKPHSMAEAVAAYTGKKFLTKAEKRQLKKQAKKLVVEDNSEDLGEEINKSDSESNYESASEYHSTDSLPLPTPTESASSESLSLPTNTSTESLPFAEFNSEGSLSVSSEDGDFDDNFDEAGSNSEDEQFEDNTSDEDADLEKLKEDLIRDAFDAHADADEEEDDDEEEEEEDESIKKAPLSSLENSTPPTSPDEKSTEQKPPKTDKEVTYEKAQSPPLDNFYRINENANDRGSNNSVRISKNWDPEYLTKKPVGLLNHGVTCYMNSAIQAIIHVPAIQHYLNEIYQGKHNKTLPPRSVSHVLAELSQKMWGLESGHGHHDGNKKKNKHLPKYINPKRIVQRLDDINCMMSEWQQEDSHEYFMSLMSRLQEDSTPKGKKLNESIVYDIFGGLLSQSVTCQNCNHISKTKQEFYDLSLGLSKKRKGSSSVTMPENETDEHPTNKYSIEKSIKDFFAAELIKLDRKDKNSGYYCEHCKERNIATKVSTIDISPETLTIHLKRFKFNGNSSSKLKQSISYSKYLDLSEFSTTNEPIKYQLIAVIVHEGRSISSGHYIAHCLQPDGNWSTYDDEYINSINEREALNDPSAYFLIYTKLTPKSNKRSSAGDEPVSKRTKI